MDGVLVDSEPVHMKAFEVLIKSLGKKFDKNYYYQFIGSTTDHMWDKVIEDGFGGRRFAQMNVNF